VAGPGPGATQGNPIAGSSSDRNPVGRCPMRLSSNRSTPQPKNRNGSGGNIFALRASPFLQDSVLHLAGLRSPAPAILFWASSYVPLQLSEFQVTAFNF